jgi:hypothetical protein
MVVFDYASELVAINSYGTVIVAVPPVATCDPSQTNPFETGEGPDPRNKSWGMSLKDA